MNDIDVESLAEISLDYYHGRAEARVEVEALLNDWTVSFEELDSVERDKKPFGQKLQVFVEEYYKERQRSQA